MLLSLKCSARVQSEGGQEGSFGPVFLRFLRFQKLQTWIIPNSTSVADTGQSGETGKKKRRKINTPNPGHLSEIGCVGRAFSLQIRAVVCDHELDPAPGSSSVELIQAQGKIQCARSKWKHSSLDFWIDSLNSESGNTTGTPSTAPGRSILAPNTSRNRENFVGQTP